jgi:hypothetical protein
MLLKAQRVAVQGLHFFCNHCLRFKHNLICFIGLQCVGQFRLLVFVQPDFNLHVSCSAASVV